MQSPQSERIQPKQRILLGIGIKIVSAIEPDWISLEETHQIGVVGAVEGKVESVACIPDAIVAHEGKRQIAHAAVGDEPPVRLISVFIRQSPIDVRQRQDLPEFVGMRDANGAVALDLRQQFAIGPLLNGIIHWLYLYA